MFRAQLIGQTKVTARGYIEVRRKVWTLVPLLLTFAVLGAKYRQGKIFWGALMLEALDYAGKILDYRYQPAHGYRRGMRGTRVRYLREVAHLFGLEIGRPGTRRKLA